MKTTLSQQYALAHPYPFPTPSDPLIIGDDTSPVPANDVLEWRRQYQQTQLLTSLFDAVFPQPGDLAEAGQVLELGCDPNGDWVRHLAQTYPHLQVIGITPHESDAQQAQLFQDLQRCQNARFLVHSLGERLPLPAESVDLIQSTFLHARVPEQRWPHVIEEVLRLLRPGGIVRLIECLPSQSSSPSAGRLTGHYWRTRETLTAQEHGGVPERLWRPTCLPVRLVESGFVSVQHIEHLLNFSAGAPGHQVFCELADLFFTRLQPVCLHHTDCTEATYTRLYQEMQLEFLEPTFRGYWHLRLLWARKPYTDRSQPSPCASTTEQLSQILIEPPILIHTRKRSERGGQEHYTAKEHR